MASSGGSPGPQRVSSASTRKSTFDSNGDIEIHYKPKTTNNHLSDSKKPLYTMKEVLNSISGSSFTKLKRKSTKKMSLGMNYEIIVDLFTKVLTEQVDPRFCKNCKNSVNA